MLCSEDMEAARHLQEQEELVFFHADSSMRVMKYPKVKFRQFFAVMARKLEESKKLKADIVFEDK